MYNKNSIPAYASQGLCDIFSTKNKFAKWVLIWQKQVKTLVDLGLAPQEAYDELSAVQADDELVKKFKEYEKITHHDINAGIKYLSELCPAAAKYIHAGLTSMDVDDNGRVLQQREALSLIHDKLPDSPEFFLKGKRVSGAIGTSQDIISYLGSVDLAEVFSNMIMDELGTPYYLRTTQIYPREQDLDLGNYLVALAKRFVEKDPANEVINRLYNMMLGRVNTLFINAYDDIDHRTIADSANRRVEIPELFMLLEGIIHQHTGAFYKKGSWTNPLLRYASKEVVQAINDDDFDGVKAELKKGLVNSINNLSKKVKQYKGIIYLARTHLQPAQLTTVGRFLSLTLDKLVGYTQVIDEVSAGTFPDFVSELSSSLGTFFNTLFFKQSQRQWFEPFKKTQVGSSVMAYKRNPHKTERGKSLSRMVPGRVTAIKSLPNDYLDMQELMLITSGQLNTFNYVLSAEDGLVVNEFAVNQEIDEFKHQVFQTTFLQEATKRGSVREDSHNELRDLMLEGKGVQGIKESQYFKELFGDELSSVVDELYNLDLKAFIGTSISDAEASLKDAQVVLDQNKDLIDDKSSAKLTV